MANAGTKCTIFLIPRKRDFQCVLLSGSDIELAVAQPWVVYFQYFIVNTLLLSPNRKVGYRCCYWYLLGRYKCVEFRWGKAKTVLRRVLHYLFQCQYTEYVAAGFVVQHQVIIAFYTLKSHLLVYTRHACIV